ncbi:MAG TPA: serine hydrolase domain-containing protein [Vicinamibacterales bacterium]|nr:serine hydrolase domain-containing protein [Vicinamibacterales bacterium]
MHTLRIAVLAIALVVAAVGHPATLAQQTADDPTFESLARLVTAKMQEYRVPGVAIGVLRDGRTTIRGFGVRNVNDPQPVTSSTVFPLASISKTVTTTAMMRLVEQGKIDLRAPVRKYLPDFRVADEAASRDVTIWHLVTHTSGWEGQLSAADKGDETLARFVASLGTDMQLAPPGAAWSYNNAGFGVAGRVIEVVTGQTFSDAIDDLVFRPLGLKLAFTRVGDVVAHWPAVGHVAGPDGAPGMQRTFSLGSTLPAGGVAMSMDNLLEYARFHLADGKSAGGTQVLARTTLAEMQKAQLHKQGYDEDIGLAWHLRTVGNIRTAAHGGTFSGHILLLELVPEKNFAIAILTNSGNGWRLIQDVEREALRAYHGATFALNQAIGHRGLNETLPAVKPLASQPDVAPYVGTYERPMNTVEVRAEGNYLVVRVRPRNREADAPMPIAFYGPDRAVVTSGPEQQASIEFLRDQSGAVNWVRITGRIAKRTGERPRF